MILIYQQTFGGIPGTPLGHVETAVWGDGRIVWRTKGSLVQGRVDTKKIDGLLQRLHRDGMFGDGKVDCGHWGPDSTFEAIEVRLADRELHLSSWHELYEQNPQLVATSSGVESLGSRNRAAVLAAEPEEYQRFRRTWSDIRTTVRSWTPLEGEPFTGTIRFGLGGKLTE
ncbi:MAG: hypothetical protein ACHRHE_06500 [Tepidisphaerales bacterium]